MVFFPLSTWCRRGSTRIWRCTGRASRGKERVFSQSCISAVPRLAAWRSSSRWPRYMAIWLHTGLGTGPQTAGLPRSIRGCLTCGTGWCGGSHRWRTPRPGAKAAVAKRRSLRAYETNLSDWADAFARRRSGRRLAGPGRNAAMVAGLDHILPHIRGAAGVGSAVVLIDETDFADERQVAIALRVINAIAHDKFIGDLEPDPVGAEIHLPATGLVQQRDGSQPRRLA